MGADWVNLSTGTATLLAFVVLVVALLRKRREKKENTVAGGPHSGGVDTLVEGIESVLSEHQGVAEAIKNQLSPDQLLKVLKVVERVVTAVAAVTPNQLDDKVAQVMSRFVSVVERHPTLLNLLTKVVNTILNQAGK